MFPIPLQPSQSCLPDPQEPLSGGLRTGEGKWRHQVLLYMVIAISIFVVAGLSHQLLTLILT